MKRILVVLLLSLVLVPAAQAGEVLDLKVHDALTEGVQVSSNLYQHQEYNTSVDKLVQSEADNRRLQAEVKHKNKGLWFAGGVVVAWILHDMSRNKGGGGGEDVQPDPKPKPKPRPRPCITF